MFKNNVYIVVALAAVSTCSGVRSSEQKKTASMHMIKQKRPVPRIRGLPEGMGEGFMLLVQGYQVTGRCVADLRAHTEGILKSLRSPQLPTVIINLALDYFASKQDSEAMSKIFEDNWWALFEKHIGKPSLCSDEVVISPGVSELFKRKLESDDVKGAVEKHVIVSCLRDLQDLAELGLAYNPYAYVIRYQMTQDFPCPGCGIELIFANSEDSCFSLSGKEFWRQDVSPVQALINAFVKLQGVQITCGKCREHSLVMAQPIIVEKPQLFMAITRDNETFSPQIWHDAPEKLEHSGSTFELCGLTMRHYYGVKEYFYRSIAWNKEQRVVYQRGFFPSYHTQEFGFVAGDYLKNLGGEFATQAMLYRYAGPTPHPHPHPRPRARARDATICHCIIS